jgi:hypothetical protein
MLSHNQDFIRNLFPDVTFFRSSHFNSAFLSLNELVITETELKLMASAAIIGESSIPKMGYSTPAASGIPSVL